MKRGLYPHNTAVSRHTPQALRNNWRALLSTARDLGAPQAYRAGLRPAAIESRLLDFQNLLREARPELFPVEGASVAFMTEGFLRVGRAFAIAGSPELREIFGTPLIACAEALIDILDGARDERARAFNRRVMGDRDD